MFCFPHAGGSAFGYADWEQYFAADIELYALEAPNKLEFLNGGPLDGINDFVESIVPALESLCDLPFCFFGHSAGATLALYTAQYLASRGLPVPSLLVLSGDSGPLSDGWYESHKALAEQSADKTAADLMAYGGIPQEFCEDAKFMEGMVAAFQKDIRVVASFAGADHRGIKLSSDFLAITGDADEAAPKDTLTAWKSLSSGSFTLRTFPGGHFYWLDEQGLPSERTLGEIGSLVSQALKNTVDASRAAAAALVKEWNTSSIMDYPCDKLLHELFMEQAAQSPNAIAIVDGTTGKSMTFKEVDEQTDLLARALHLQGVGPDKAVGILMERCSEFILSYIAALKAGGAYMPLEVVYPADLLGRVCESAEPVVVMTKPSFVEKLPDFQRRFVFTPTWLTELKEANPPPMPEDRELPNPLSLAYVVMSSGTTGVPKGICCPHRGAVYSYHWRHVNYPFIVRHMSSRAFLSVLKLGLVFFCCEMEQEQDRIACNVFFVWECLRPLLKGYPTYIIPDNAIYDPSR